MSETIHLLIYAHEYGEDRTAYETEKLAMQKGGAIVEEYYETGIGDEATQRKIKRALAAKKFDVAINAYNNAVDGEHIAIDELPVIPAPCAHCAETRANHADDGKCLFGATSWRKDE